MLTIISQRLVLRHPGISSRCRTSEIGGKWLLLFARKLISSTALRNALEEAWKGKQLGRGRVTDPRRDPVRAIRVGPFRSILGRQVYPQREARFLFRRLGWRRPGYRKAMAAFMGRQIRLHRRAHSGVESREEEEERGGQGRQSCKNQYVHSLFFRRCSCCSLLVYLNVRIPSIAQGDLHMREAMKHLDISQHTTLLSLRRPRAGQGLISSDIHTFFPPRLDGRK